MNDEKQEVKWFLINSEQVQVVFNVLGELAAKFSYDVITMLRSLQEVQVQKVPQEQEAVEQVEEVVS